MPHVIAIIKPSQGTGTQSTTAVAVTSTSIIAALTTRKALSIQNISDTAVHISLDGTAAAVTDFLLVASGGSWENPAHWCPTGEVFAIHAGTGTKNVVVYEA